MQDLGTIEIGLILKILTSKGNNPWVSEFQMSN